MGSVSTESGLKSEGGLILVKRVGPAEGWARATSLRLGLKPVPTDVREASLCPRRVGCPATTGTEEGAAGSVAASWLPALSFSTPETHAGTPMAGKEGSGCLTPWGWAGRAPGCPNPLVWPSELGFGGLQGADPVHRPPHRACCLESCHRDSRPAEPGWPGAPDPGGPVGRGLVQPEEVL